MDRGLSRSLPFLPRYHSVSPARAPRKFYSTRSLSQPSHPRIMYMDGERSRLTNHHVRRPSPSSPRHVSPFHSLTSPAPKNKPIKVILVNTKLTATPLYRISHTGSWNDLNSSHMYRSLESLHHPNNNNNHRHRRIVYNNKLEVVSATASSSCDDIYHKGPFFPDASSHSESGISVGESEEDGREERNRDEEEEDDDTDAASQYSYASSSAFFETTIDSEYDKAGESDNDVFFTNGGKLSPAVLASRGYGTSSSKTVVMMSSPLSSYAEARKRELMTSPSWEMLEKLSPSRQQLVLHSHSHHHSGHNNHNTTLKVAIPEASAENCGTSRNSTGVATPLAQSTPHVSPRSFYGPPTSLSLSAVKAGGSWMNAADSPRGGSDSSVISCRTMGSLSENESINSNSRCSSFSEDYDDSMSMTSECASPPKSKSAAKAKVRLTKRTSEMPNRHQNSINITDHALSSRKNENDNTCIDDDMTNDAPKVYIPPLESVVDLDESTLASKSDEGEGDDDDVTPRATQWWAVFNIGSAKARKEADANGGNNGDEDGLSNFDFDFVNRGEVKIVKPVKSGIPLISAGRYGKEKLKKTTISPPPSESGNGSGSGRNKMESARRSLTYQTEPGSTSSDNNSDDGADSSSSRRKSPPLLSLSPILQQRVANNKENNNHSKSDNEIAFHEGNQGGQPCELSSANDQSGNGTGNLPCSPQLTSKEQRGVSTTFDYEVRTDLDRLTAHASPMDQTGQTVDGDINNTSVHNINHHHHQREQPSILETPTSKISSMAAGVNAYNANSYGDRNSKFTYDGGNEGRGDEGRCFVSANTDGRHHVRHRPDQLDNSDKKKNDDNDDNDDDDERQTHLRRDKRDGGMVIENWAPGNVVTALLLSHDVELGVNELRPNNTTSTNSSPTSSSKGESKGGEEGVWVVGERGNELGGNYVLPVDDNNTNTASSCKITNNNSSNTTPAHSSFSRYQNQSKDEDKEETNYDVVDCADGKNGVVDCNSVLKFDFDGLCDDGTNTNKSVVVIEDFVVDSPRVVQLLCQDFQALSLNDLVCDDSNSSKATTNTVTTTGESIIDDRTRTGQAPDRFDDRADYRNENVSVNKAETAPGSNTNTNYTDTTADVSIGKEEDSVVVLRRRNDDKDNDKGKIINNKNKGAGDDVDVETSPSSVSSLSGELLTSDVVNNSMKRCARSINRNSLSRCLSCHRGEKDGEGGQDENEQEGGIGHHHRQHNYSIPHGCPPSTAIDLTDGKKGDGEKSTRGITNESGEVISPLLGEEKTINQIPTRTEKDSNANDNNNNDNKEASINDEDDGHDNVFFDVRDNKILLTISSTPGNIISITHTVIPIEDLDDSQSQPAVPSSKAPLLYQYHHHRHYDDNDDGSGSPSQLPYSSGNSTADELPGYEAIMTGFRSSSSSNSSNNHPHYQEQQQLFSTTTATTTTTTHPPHLNNYNHYTVGHDDDDNNNDNERNDKDNPRSSMRMMMTTKSPEDRRRAAQWSADQPSESNLSNVLWQQAGRFGQDYNKHCDKRSSGGSSGIERSSVVVLVNENENIEDESIRHDLSSSSATGGMGVGSNSSSSEIGWRSGGGGGDVNKVVGIPQHSLSIPKAEREGGGGQSESHDRTTRRGITIFDAQKINDDEDAGIRDVTAQESTTQQQRRRGDIDDKRNSSGDREFLLQQKEGEGRLLYCSDSDSDRHRRQPLGVTVTTFDVNDRVNNSSSSSFSSAPAVSSSTSSTTTTKIVKKIHRKTVEETVTIERTVVSAATPTINSTNSNNSNRSGVFTDCGSGSSINSRGRTIGGQLLSTKEAGGGVGDGARFGLSECEGSVLDYVKSSTNRKEETVIEQDVDFISTCELLSSNQCVVVDNNDGSHFCADENNAGYNDNFDVSRDLRTTTSNGAERSGSTDPVSGEPFINPPQTSIENEQLTHLNDWSARPDIFDNNNNNIITEESPENSTTTSTMRGDRFDKMRGNALSSPGGGYSLPSPNQSVLDNIQTQLSTISNNGGSDGNTTPSPMRHLSLQEHLMNTGPFYSPEQSDKTYHDHRPAVTAVHGFSQSSPLKTDKVKDAPTCQYNHGKGVSSGINGPHHNNSNSIGGVVTPQYSPHHINNNNVVSQSSAQKGHISPMGNVQYDNNVSNRGPTTVNITSASNTPSQKTSQHERRSNNNTGDYDYVISNSDSHSTGSSSSPRNHVSSSNNNNHHHHHLVLLKPGQARPSSLWTLQEETESLLDGLSPRQTTTSPTSTSTRPFHSMTVRSGDSVDSTNNVIIHSDSNGTQDSSSYFLPPPVEFMDSQINQKNNADNKFTRRVLASANYGQKPGKFSDYSELDETENAMDVVDNYPSSTRSHHGFVNVSDQRSKDIDQEVAQSLSDIERNLRALNGRGQFDYSSDQPRQTHVVPAAAHCSSSATAASGTNGNSFYDFVSGIAAGGSSGGDFTFDFANKSHVNNTSTERAFLLDNNNQTSPHSGGLYHKQYQQHLPMSTPVWKHHHEYATSYNNDNSNNNHEDVMNSSIASSSNMSSNQDVQSEASSRLQILDLDLSRISSCASPAPSDFSEGSSAYTCRGTAEIKKNVSVSFDDDYDMLPVNSTPRLTVPPSSTPRRDNTTTKLKSALKKPSKSFDNDNIIAKQKHEADLCAKAMRANWAEQFDKIIEDFNNKTSRLGPDSEIAVVEGQRGDNGSRIETSNSKTVGEDLYKTFVNNDSEKKQNHVCIVDEPEDMDTFRFKRFLKKSHTRRNTKGKRLVRFLSRLSCVSESVQQPSSPEHINDPTCTKKARLANGSAYTTESQPLPAEREPVVLTASSASRLAHHHIRANSPTHFTSNTTLILTNKEKDHNDNDNNHNHSPTSSIQSLDSLRSRTDSAYSSVSESIVLHHSPPPPQSQIINNNNNSHLHSSSPSSSSPSSTNTRLVSHPDSAFSSMSESVTLSTSSLSAAEDQTCGSDGGNYSSDMLSALSDVFYQLDVCEDQIDQALLNRLRYSHRSAPHNRNS